MNSAQASAVDLALAGHNFVLTGQAGSGKSFTLQEIFLKLKGEGKNVALTCTTGIACANYPMTIGAKTLHHFAGLGDGRFSASQLSFLVMNDEKYQQAKQRLVKTDVLIIDEVSMLSAKMLDILIMCVGK